MQIERLNEACVGCMACVNACPADAIVMDMNEEGFYYPQIKQEKCLSCHGCDNACPVININKLPMKSQTSAQGVINKDITVRRSSSSGGAFTILAEYVLALGGVVFGAGLKNGIHVVHKQVRDTKGLQELRGSKYVQSDMNKVYQEAKEHLDNGVWVLFTGTPCEVAALYKYLPHEYDNLITADFVCHGSASPGVWESYMCELSQGMEVNRVSFREKDATGNCFFTFCGQNVKKQFPAGESTYMQSFFQNMILRPSCHKCAFRGIDRISDFTMGDLWGREILCPEFSDSLGTSLLMLRGGKAIKIWEKIKDNAEYVEIKPADAARFNPSIVTPTKMSTKRQKFFASWRKSDSTLSVLRKFTKQSYIERNLGRLRQYIGRERRRVQIWLKGD